jgi:hypothetical protein
VNLFCGKASTLAFLQAPIPKVTDRTNNNDVQHWFGRYHLMKENIVPTCIATDKMLADGLKKLSSGPEMQTCLPEIGMHVGALKGLEKGEKEWKLLVQVVGEKVAWMYMRDQLDSE